MGRNKTGPKKKHGDRYACGKLKPTGDPIQPAAWERIRSEVVKFARDQRLGSQVGRLSFHKQLTDAQTAAAFRVAAIYGSFDRWHGRRRSARSPSYEMGYRGDSSEVADELMSPEARADRDRAMRAADEAFGELQDELESWPRADRDALERLCVDDRALVEDELIRVRAILTELTQFFGQTSKKRKRTRTRVQARPEAAPAPAPGPARPARTDPDKAAWIKAMKIMRPDLDDDRLEEAYRLLAALREREAFNRA